MEEMPIREEINLGLSTERGKFARELFDRMQNEGLPVEKYVTNFSYGETQDTEYAKCLPIEGTPLSSIILTNNIWEISQENGFDIDKFARVWAEHEIVHSVVHARNFRRDFVPSGVNVSEAVAYGIQDSEIYKKRLREMLSPEEFQFVTQKIAEGKKVYFEMFTNVPEHLRMNKLLDLIDQELKENEYKEALGIKDEK